MVSLALWIKLVGQQLKYAAETGKYATDREIVYHVMQPTIKKYAIVMV
jgi:hypothetical protein